MAVETNRKGGSPGQGRIVVGVDGSEPSKEALRWAARQAQVTGASLRVVMAWEYPTSYAWAPSYPLDFNPDVDTRKVLDATIEEVLGGDPPVEVQSVVVEGHPVSALLGVAKGADLLVVGCRGHGTFAGLLLGSVSQHCITHASCPVVVIHRHSPARSGPEKDSP